MKISILYNFVLNILGKRISNIMNQVLIFGTGSSAEKVLDNICIGNVDIIGYLDNSVKRQDTLFHGVNVFSPEKCIEMEFNYILIASVKYEPITEELLGFGVPEEKILPYFSFRHSDYERYRGIVHIEGMVYDELRLEFEGIEKYINNMDYEIASKLEKNKIQLPLIKSIDETIDEIIEKRLSISRYGDGEFDQIDGRREGYQEPDPLLSERLKEVLVKPVPGHIVGLADIYGDLSHLDKKYADYFRNVMLKYRQNHYEYIDMDRVYYNAFVSRIYSEMKDKSKSKGWFEKTKKIWDGRDVVIVEGVLTRFGAGNTLLDNAGSVKRILCPSEGAFGKYQQILDTCCQFKKNVNLLFILALGPTATVLAYDLAKKGYQAVDIGHFDIEYEWYLRGVKEHKVIIEGKYVNEVAGGNNVTTQYNDEKYINEIIKEII